jgi:RimJ/RimL family protein N-acetyltransferase
MNTHLQADDPAEPVITIRGELVGLGPLRRDLLDTVFLRWGNDVAAGMTLGGVGFATSESNMRYFEHRTSRPDVEEMLVYELATLRPIGTTNLHDINRDERSAEIAVNIMEADCRRKGYGTEATRLTLDYAFTAQGLHRVQARVFAYNEPSQRMLRRVGFTEFGRAREARWAGGRYWDVLMFDILSREFESPVLLGELSFLQDENDSRTVQAATRAAGGRRG